jgi:hypothetical protein
MTRLRFTRTMAAWKTGLTFTKKPARCAYEMLAAGGNAHGLPTQIFPGRQKAAGRNGLDTVNGRRSYP